MVTHLFPDFLANPVQYDQAEAFWANLWEQIDRSVRTNFEWTHPWLGTGSPELRDGNPIFSAYSPKLRRGIRVIQHEPTGPGVEIVAYPDTFGGTIYDPSSIKELVISCALSDVTSRLALALMRPWVAHEAISFKLPEYGMFTPAPERQFERDFDGYLIPAA